MTSKDQSLRAPRGNPPENPRQAGDLHPTPQSPKIQVDTDPGFKLNKRKREKGANFQKGIATSPPVSAKRPNRLEALWAAASAVLIPPAGSSPQQGGMAEEAEETPGHAQYTGKQQEGVWRPAPEDSFRQGYGDIPALFDGEKKDVWESAIALFKGKRESSNKETLESEALNVIGSVFPGLQEEQVAPHVLSQVQVVVCLPEDFDSSEFYQYYEQNPNRLQTAVILPKPKSKPKPKQVPPPSPPDTEILTGSQVPIAQMTAAGARKQARKSRSATPKPQAVVTSVRYPTIFSSFEQGAGPSGAGEEADVEEIPQITTEKPRSRPATRGLQRAMAAVTTTGPPSPASQRPPPQTWNLSSLRTFVLNKRQAQQLAVAQEFKKLRSDYQPPPQPKLKLSTSLTGYALTVLKRDFPGLATTDTPGQPSLLISQGNPMRDSDGMTQQVARRLATWAAAYPQGQDPQTKNPLYSVSELERNDFIPTLYLRKDGKGAVTLSRVGDLRTKEDMEKFRSNLDKLTTEMDTLGEVLSKEKLNGHKAPVLDPGQKVFHTLPIYFSLGLRIFLPPVPTPDGKYFKFTRWEIPRQHAVDPKTLTPGDPLFVIDDSNNRFAGVWFTAFCDFPDLPDGGGPCPVDLLHSASDIDAMAAAFAVDGTKPVPANNTRFIFYRFMGGYQGGDWTPQFCPVSQFRAVRYHIMEARTYAKKGEERYLCRELSSTESPAGMVFTPGFYQTPPEQGKPKTNIPQISIYSEYISWLDRRLVPFPEAAVTEFNNLTHPYRWFEDFRLPDDLYPYTSPCAPKGIQTWVAELWDQQGNEDDVVCIYGKTELPVFPSLAEERQETLRTQQQEAARETPGSKRKAEGPAEEVARRGKKRGPTRSPAPGPATRLSALVVFARNLIAGGPDRFDENITLNPLDATESPLFELFLQIATAVAPLSRDAANIFVRLANGVLKRQDLAEVLRFWRNSENKPSDCDKRDKERDDAEREEEEEEHEEGGGDKGAPEYEEEGGVPGGKGGSPGAREGTPEGGDEQGGEEGGEQGGSDKPRDKSPTAGLGEVQQTAALDPGHLTWRFSGAQPRNLHGFRSPSPRRGVSQSSSEERTRRGRSASRSVSSGRSSSPSGTPPGRAVRYRSVSPVLTRPARTETFPPAVYRFDPDVFEPEGSEQVCYSTDEPDDFADLGEGEEESPTETDPDAPKPGPPSASKGDGKFPSPEGRPKGGVTNGAKPPVRSRLIPQKRPVQERLSGPSGGEKTPLKHRLGPSLTTIPVRERLGPVRNDALSHSPKTEPQNPNGVKKPFRPQTPFPREERRGITVVEAIKTVNQLREQVKTAERTKEALELAVQALRGADAAAGEQSDCAALAQKEMEISNLRMQIAVAEHTKMAVARRETEKIHEEVAEFMKGNPKRMKKLAGFSPEREHSGRGEASRRLGPPPPKHFTDSGRTRTRERSPASSVITTAAERPTTGALRLRNMIGATQARLQTGWDVAP
ncbi:hypothetical protein KFL_007540040 [Klebsormidium nitens]|uniref:Uncharacterized protein n=1 Tax=Klebsormidium nitens TaxID=105231 RepID=A0A1Y1IR85_KLENI|nr:hypothetical protein KFL_007540040 [Klebsormidium nitens]|eukprot:GAQ91266.1 hypothetical protein KFL_007540040 [Klebsormidium nitens]